MTDDWHKMYGEGWTGLIVPESFSHPAKFSRALIRNIYQHALEEGWVKPGDVVIDPFGGVALGALDAQINGLSWVGVELEQKFVDLGQQNLDLWQRKYSSLPKWSGRANILQGDSRNLAAIVQGAGLGVSSPPFCDSDNRGAAKMAPDYFVRSNGTPFGEGKSIRGILDDPRNLGNLPAGSLSVSSPPFSSPGCQPPAMRSHAPVRSKWTSEQDRPDNYGSTDGNLGNMPIGAISVSSPPFGEGETRDRSPVQGGFIADCITRSYTQDKQGTTEGNLATLACSSPPFEKSNACEDKNYQTGRTGGGGPLYGDYGDTAGNIGNQQGETFWGAARTIVEQLYLVLRPGAHAVWVTKRFIRNKEIVDFSAQWATLCEACGFRLVHQHRAWLVEHRGTQFAFSGDAVDKQVERKSFFRRLAESKGSPRIDWEDILCMERRD